MPSPFLCCPVNCECSWKKTKIEKKMLLLHQTNFHISKESSRKNIKTKNDKIREKKLQYKILHLSIICSTCENKNQKIFKQEELIEILKNLNWGLIKNI